MKLGLGAWLTGCQQKGLSRVRVVSPRNHLLAQLAAVDLAEGELQALCEEDAGSMPRGKRHEYVLTAEGEAGTSSRFVLRVDGGLETSDLSGVDPMMVQTPGAVIGHLCKTVVELVKQNTTLAMKRDDRDVVYVRELEKSRRQLARVSESQVLSQVLQLEAEDKRESRARSASLLREVVGLAAPLAMRMLGPAGQASALEQFKSSLSEDQLEGMAKVIGTRRAMQVLAFATPAKVADFLITHVSPDEIQAITALLSQEQGAMLGAAIQEEMKRRAEAETPKAAEAPAANGAPS